MLAAEKKLLCSGMDWFDEWVSRNSEGLLDKPSCHVDISDVAVEGGHIHQVRYLKGPPPIDPASSQNNLESGTALVLVHGFGAGVGIYYSALPALRAAWNGPVFALDWFGCSLSSRPKWSFGHGNEADTLGIERFFTDPLEQWRVATGLERMVIVGHSIGGYLAGCYTACFPERVEHLVLASPAGVSGQIDMDPPEKQSLAVDAVWNYAGINPLIGIWHLSQHIGRLPLRMWFSCFASASWLQREQLVEYHYQSALQEISGGHCLTGLLDGPSMARSPLSRRLPAHVPLTVIYGTRDSFLRASRPGLDSLTKLTGNEPKVFFVAGAGHDMMIDNPLGFAEAAVCCLAEQPVTRKSFGEEVLLRERSKV